MSLYGRRLAFKGLEFCYDATAINATLDHVFLRVMRAAAGDGTLIAEVADGTDRDDEACRFYGFATPMLLTEDDYLHLAVRGGFSGASNLHFSRATFVLLPTDQASGPV